VQNLSEEVETEAFYDFFSKFGEILQCKTDTDNYGQVRRSTSQHNTAHHHTSRAFWQYLHTPLQSV
jgi:RNA recognition motif-containing protein